MWYVNANVIADLLLRTAVERGWYAAPRILGAGRAISSPGGHGAGGGCAYASGEREFYEAALAELEAGADHVKIFISGGLNRTGENLGLALRHGVRCFEHIYQIDDKTAALLAQPGIFVTPTLCVTRSEGWMRAAGFPEAGLSPLPTLQSASVNAADLLGIGDHVGQIQPGYVADFVAVDGDPLDDLAAMRTISLVVQAGHVVRDDTR